MTAFPTFARPSHLVRIYLLSLWHLLTLSGLITHPILGFSRLSEALHVSLPFVQSRIHFDLGTLHLVFICGY